MHRPAPVEREPDIVLDTERTPDEMRRLARGLRCGTVLKIAGQMIERVDARRHGRNRFAIYTEQMPLF